MFTFLVYLFAWFGVNVLSVLIAHIIFNGIINARQDIPLIILVGFTSLPVWYLIIAPVARSIYKRRK